MNQQLVNQLVGRTEVAGNACANSYLLALRMRDRDVDVAYRALRRAEAWMIRELDLYLQLQQEVDR